MTSPSDEHGVVVQNAAYFGPVVGLRPGLGFWVNQDFGSLDSGPVERDLAGNRNVATSSFVIFPVRAPENFPGSGISVDRSETAL